MKLDRERACDRGNVLSVATLKTEEIIDFDMVWYDLIANLPLWAFLSVGGGISEAESN